MKNKQFSGTGVAVVTPFHKEGAIDFASFEKVLINVLQNHIDYVVVLGTTGESATLNQKEKEAVINTAIEIVDKKVPVVVGVGGNNTQNVLDILKKMNYDGIDAILSVAPYYNKPSQKGLFIHFRAINNESKVPIIAYNVPGRTAVNLHAETTLKIANELDNVIGIKEASGDLVQIMNIIKDKPKDFLVISGDDALTLPMIAAGADGVISVVANIYPAQFSQMVEDALQGNFTKAAKNHYFLFDLIDALFAEGSPSGIKAALSLKGLCQNYFRLPVVKVTRAHMNALDGLLKEIESQI